MVALSFLFSGFISSIIIQFLSKLNSNKYRYNDNKFSEQKYPIPPPSSSPSREYSPSQKSVYQDNYEDNFVDNQDTKLRDEFQAQPNIKFAKEEKISTRYESEKIINQPEILTPEKDNNYDYVNKIKSQELEKIIVDKSQEIITDDNFNDVDEDDNLPSESTTKPRQSSPYSYQTREKTEIIPQQTRNKRVNNNQLNNDDKIYTAPYRVITPATDEYSARYPQDNYPRGNEEDDDWDF